MIETKLSSLYTFVFPGQGSQHPGMVEHIWQRSEPVKRLFSSAQRVLGYDVADVCFADSKGQLTGKNADTSIIQPTLLTASYATYTDLVSRGVNNPQFLSGHSLGKITASVAAGVMNFETGLSFCQERGRLMQQAKELLHTVVGIVFGDEEAVQKILDSLGEKAQTFKITAKNWTKQTVIGGAESQWNSVVDACKELKIRLYPEAPLSHHPMLESVQDKLNEILSKIGDQLRNAYYPILDDVTNTLIQKAREIEGSFSNHLITPINVRGSIAFMQSRGIPYAIEVGPGRINKGLFDNECQISDKPKITTLTTDSQEDLELVSERFAKAA